MVRYGYNRFQRQSEIHIKLRLYIIQPRFIAISTVAINHGSIMERCESERRTST